MIKDTALVNLHGLMVESTKDSLNKVYNMVKGGFMTEQGKFMKKIGNMARK